MILPAQTSLSFSYFPCFLRFFSLFSAGVADVWGPDMLHPRLPSQPGPAAILAPQGLFPPYLKGPLYPTRQLVATSSNAWEDKITKTGIEV